MKHLDKWILGLLFGGVAPILFFFISFIIWFYYFQSQEAIIFVLFGIFLGLVFDSLFLKKLVNKKFHLPIGILVLGSRLFASPLYA